MEVRKDRVQSPPASLISLTHNDTCSAIAALPATDKKDSKGVMNMGMPTLCGGYNPNTENESDTCWQYNMGLDTWRPSMNIIESRYRHEVVRLSQESFLVMGTYM